MKPPKSNKIENNDPKYTRQRVSSKGKRLFAMIIDFVLALLIVNTTLVIFRKEHWDLSIKPQDSSYLLLFYGSIFLNVFKFHEHINVA